MARADGLRVRLTRLRGLTPAGILTEPLRFPAALGDFTVNEESEHRDYSTVGLGQLSQPAPGKRSRQLRTTDMETLTIEWDPAWLVQNGVDPARLKRDLYAVLRSKRPVELAARRKHGAHAPYEERMDITVRSVERTLKPGEADTLYYTVRFSEYRAATTKRRSSKEGRARGVQLPTTIKLDGDDSLRSLSKKYYGSYAGWRAIAKANGIRGWGAKDALVKSKRFKVGSRLKIPTKPPLAKAGEG